MMNVKSKYLRESDKELYRALGINFPSENEIYGHVEYKVGTTCPECGKAELAYDGLLNLTCPDCEFSLTGCFT